MDTLRKFNVVDLYFDLAGELEDKSTKKLYPQGNYQTVLYANFRASDPTNVMGVYFELANGQTLDEQPMYYVGIVENDGIRYQRWEFILPNEVVSSYRKDREVQLLIQFSEREIADFIGVYDEQSDLPTNVDSGSYAWVLEDEAVFLYSENQQETLQWTEENELQTYNQIWGSDLVNIPVARALRVTRDTVDVDTSDLVLKALAKTQGDKLNKTGDNADADISINGVTFDYLRATDAIVGGEYDPKITEIEGNVDSKFDKAGGTIEGDLTIQGETTMESDLDMTGHNIINVDSLEAINVTIGDLNIQENLDLKVSRDGTLPMTGNLNFDDNSIINIDDINGYDVESTVGEVTNIINGDTLVGRAKNTDDGLGNANTAQAIKETVDHVNQDVKDTSTPEFQGVVLGDKTLTETKLNNLDTAFNHTSLTDNPHQVTKSQVGLGNVDNTSDLNKPISTATQTALDNKADLGEDGKVVASQLPSYVDDIVEFDTLALLQSATKEVSKIYVVTDDPTPANNTSYRYTASGQLVKFDHTSAEWGHVTGTIANQTDIENATFTSTVNNGNITGTTLKTSINDLDTALKTTNSNVSTNADDIQTNADDIQTNANNIQTNATNITNIVNGTTDITFAPGSSGIVSTKVEEAIIEVQSNVDTVDGRVDDVIDGTTDIDFDKRATNLTSENIEDVIHEIYAQKGANNGIATLDADGRVPSEQLTINAIEFKGSFGSTGSTTNGDLPTENVTRGDMYICDEDNYTSTVAGITFNTGDKAIYDGTTWVKNDAQDAVISVNSKTGSVSLSATDIPVDTTNFNGELVNTDDTVQKALDRLDDHKHVENDITDLDKYTQSEVDSLLADKLDVGVLASNIILYPTTAESDVAGYDKLVTSPDDPDYDSTAVDVTTPTIDGSNVLVAELVSEANLFVGNPGIINIPIVGQIRKSQANPDVTARFYFEIYKRDDQDNEVLLGTSDPTQKVGSVIYEEFNANALLDNGVFTETDRLVFKFYGVKVGSANGTFDFKFGGSEPVRVLLNVPIQATLQANRIAYDTTNSTLTETNLQGAMDELDEKLQSNITTIRVEQFKIINPDIGDGTFSYLDANTDTQIGNYDGTWYTFDLQIAGFYANNNLVETIINDTTLYHTTDGNQLQEGTPDSEGVVTSVKVAYNFLANDEIDIRYYQGANIVAQELGDGSVSFAKLDATLQGDITEVRNASSTNAPNTLVQRNENNEFQGILNGKFKTPRTIALAGDVTGQAQFDGSTGITIQTVVAKQNFDGGNASSVFSPEDIIIEGGGA